MLDIALLKQLNHPDPERRKQAVMALAKTKDPEALSYLATVYHSDDDAEVRELARKAGLYIRKHTSAANDADEIDDEYEDEDMLDDVSVSIVDKERAEGLVRQALDMHMIGNNERAVKYLAEAFTRNPKLRKDSYTQSLASTITSLPPEEAVAAIMFEVDKKKRKQKRKRSDGIQDEPTWGAAFVELALYFLINTAQVAVVYFLMIVVFSGVTAAIIAQNPTLNQAEAYSLLALTNSAGVVLVMLFSAIAGLFSTIGIFIYCFFLHMIATGILRGEGTLPRLIVKLAVPLALASVGYTVFVAVGTFLMFGTSLAAVGSSNNALVSGTMGGLTFVLYGMILLGSFALVIFTGNRIGVAYRFGTGYGCLTLFLYAVITTLISCGLMVIIPLLMNSAIR